MMCRRKMSLMSRKVDEWVLRRLEVLKFEHKLTHEVISQRLGLSARTIGIYLKALRERRALSTTHGLSRSD